LSALFVAAGGRWLLAALFGPVYAESSGALLILMVAGTFNYVAWFLEGSLTAARRIRPQVVIALGAVIAVGLACGLLVPRLGVLGGAWAVLIGGVVELGLATVFVIRLLASADWSRGAS
jgi:O-antigen/teichoic acid export membrane protein